MANQQEETQFFPQGVDWLIKSLLIFTNGGGIDFTETGALKIGGVKVAATAAQLNTLVAGVGAGYKIARGQHTSVAAVDTVVTGLSTVVMAVAVLNDDPSLDPFLISSSIGDQSAAPVAGSIYIKTWKATAANDVTPIAATTFGKKINWIAFGT